MIDSMHDDLAEEHVDEYALAADRERVHGGDGVWVAAEQANSKMSVERGALIGDHKYDQYSSPIKYSETFGDASNSGEMWYTCHRNTGRAPSPAPTSTTASSEHREPSHSGSEGLMNKRLQSRRLGVKDYALLN